MSDERLAKEGDALLGRIHTAANAFNSRVRQSISTWLDDHDRALLREFSEWKWGRFSKLVNEAWGLQEDVDEMHREHIDRFLKERDGE